MSKKKSKNGTKSLSSPPSDDYASRKARVLLDPDYVDLGRFDHSLAALIQKYPEGAPAKVIAAALMIEEHEVEELYEIVVKKMRAIMGDIEEA